jgi:stage V sporulation protein SpoVS
MKKEEEAKKALDILKDFKNKPNKDLVFVMDFITEDFELSKKTLIKLTDHIDKLEKSYNLILKEFNNRTKK